MADMIIFDEAGEVTPEMWKSLKDARKTMLLIDVLIDIARSQQVINYGTTEIRPGLHVGGGRSEAGAHAQLLPEMLLGPATRAQGDRGTT